MGIQRILVPVDYSENAGAALAYAAFLAKRFGARLDVVHVWDRPAYVPDDVVVQHPKRGGRCSLPELILENAEQEMLDFLQRVAVPPEIPLAHCLVNGEPASKILELSKTHDLLVIGTHGRTGVRHLLLGSVAEKLVRLSSVPILTVPTRGMKPAA